MGLFGYTLTKESELDKTAYAKVEAMEKRHKGYTEHIGAIHRVGEDTSEEIVFDSMDKTDEGVKFYRYYTGYEGGKYGGWRRETIATIPYSNFKKMETVERKQREMEYTKTVTEKVPVEAEQ